MFSKHVHKELSAYCHGELSPETTKRVAEHLIGCSTCRPEYELIKLGIKFAEQLPQISAPENLWADIQVAKAQSDSSGTRSRTWSQSWLRPHVIALATCLLLVAVLGSVWLYFRETRPFWEVARLDGSPQIEKQFIKQRGKLARGQWLETDGTSRAQIEVGSIGQVEIDPNTRVRLVETNATEHRLELAQGKLSARIWAPPKLFFVDTPSAVAADLGCAYTLEVDNYGSSLLRVTAGWVALQLKDRESIVPAGAACATRPGVGPGTPYFEDASQSFRDALRDLDFDKKNSDSLTAVLENARVRDTLTLWNLLARVQGEDRVRVFDRMVELAPPPENVSRESILALNQQSLDSWKEKLEMNWGTNPSRTMKALKKVWTTGLGKINELEGKK